jgi:hypothetical protein
MNDDDPKISGNNGASGLSRGKKLAVLASVAMIVAVLWPVQENWRKNPHDSFPLSYYPMFSAKRRPIETFSYLVGHDAKGKRYLIRHSFAGHGGLNAVRRQINKKVREDRADDVARMVAKRLANLESGKWSKIVKVDVVTGRYAVDDYFHGRKEPVSEKIKASRTVERSKRSTNEIDKSDDDTKSDDDKPEDP